jgi:collagenase-like PrtC family protease
LNWKIIIKDKKNQPQTGSYPDWKEQIAEECYFQCIYCSIHEAQFGGIDHYHIEHYKPKSIERFKNLENDITNLFYSCPICNRFKSNDWPNDEHDLNIICYPNPTIHDYNNIFKLNINTFKIEGLYLSSKYIVERLYLNRPQLIYERRETLLQEKHTNLRNEIEELLSKIDDNDTLRSAYTLVNKSLDHLKKRSEIRPYKLSEIRK